jgi:hypothetical protein
MLKGKSRTKAQTKSAFPDSVRALFREILRLTDLLGASRQMSYQQQRHSNSKKYKLDPDTVRSIRRDWASSPGPNRDALGKKYRVSISTIDAIVKRKIWKDVV